MEIYRLPLKLNRFVPEFSHILHNLFYALIYLVVFPVSENFAMNLAESFFVADINVHQFAGNPVRMRFAENVFPIK